MARTKTRDGDTQAEITVLPVAIGLVTSQRVLRPELQISGEKKQKPVSEWQSRNFIPSSGNEEGRVHARKTLLPQDERNKGLLRGRPGVLRFMGLQRVGYD